MAGVPGASGYGENQGAGRRLVAARIVVAAFMAGSSIGMLGMTPAGASPRRAQPPVPAPTRVADQITTATARLASTLRLPHPGQPEPLTHPGADHAGIQAAPSSGVRPSARSASPQVSAVFQSGLDVSSFQGNVDWAQVAANGAQFAYAKASEGTYYTNPFFPQQYQGADLQGLIRGAYHFAIPDNSTGAAQADFFVSNGGGWSPDNHTLPGMVDLEYNPYGAVCYGLSQAQMVSWVASFVNEYFADTGRWPVIYTTTDWWSTCTGNSASFAGHDPLWIANYSASPNPLPAGWATYSIWQYNDTGVFPGDQDVFNGSPAQLLSLANADPVTAYYAQLGGSGSYLGNPTDDRYPVAGGEAQDFAGGSIFWSPGTGAHSVHGAILTHYQALGGPAGFLGFPFTDETATPGGVGRFNRFANGVIYWSPATGAWSLRGAILAHYQALGGPGGVLGFPLTDETGTPDGVGRFNHFSNDGSIYWTPGTGAWSVHGAIYDHWAALRWEAGPLGYPVTDETGTPDGVGRYNHFSNDGSIYWTPGTGAWSVHGAIYDLWASIGWEASNLGYPTSDEYAIPGGRQNNFVSGVISWNPTAGAARKLG